MVIVLIILALAFSFLLVAASAWMLSVWVPVVLTDPSNPMAWFVILVSLLIVFKTSMSVGSK